MLVFWLLVVTGTGLMVMNFPLGSLERQRQMETALALDQARQAVLAHATTLPERHAFCFNSLHSEQTCDAPPSLLRVALFPPGFLPCPELASNLVEGREAGSCGAKGVSSLGRLPWESLATAPLRDGYGHCLWYAVSGNYKNNPKADVLNRDIPGQFRIVDAQTGQTIADDVVAVLFSPGPPLAGQNRTTTFGSYRYCGDDFSAAAYLDAHTVAGASINNANISTTSGAITTLVAGHPGAAHSASFNDQLVWITRSELFAVIDQRPDIQRLFDASQQGPALAQRSARCLARFGNKNPTALDRRLPWAAPLVISDFSNGSFNDQSGLLAGRLPFLADHSRSATGNTLMSGCSGTSGSSSCRLLRPGTNTNPVCSSGPGVAVTHDPWKPVAGDPGNWNSNSLHGWWDKWKDHLFYALAPAFTPTATAPARTSLTPCALGNCLTVDGTGPYAAVVVDAGPPLGTQQRQNHTDRTTLGNYLEGQNTLALTPGHASYGQFTTLASNDRFSCLIASSTDTTFTLVPECGQPASCPTLASELASRFPPATLATSACRNASGIEAGCEALRQQLNTSACTCRTAADTLLTPSCLDTPANSSCQNALIQLGSC